MSRRHEVEDGQASRIRFEERFEDHPLRSTRATVLVSPMMA
jgi:hypothetical protein